MHVDAPCACSAPRGQKRVLDPPLERESQKIVGHCVVAGNWHLGLLEEESVLLTSEPALQTLNTSSYVFQTSISPERYISNIFRETDGTFKWSNRRLGCIKRDSEASDEAAGTESMQKGGCGSRRTRVQIEAWRIQVLSNVSSPGGARVHYLWLLFPSPSQCFPWVQFERLVRSPQSP